MLGVQGGEGRGVPSRAWRAWAPAACWVLLWGSCDRELTVGLKQVGSEV